MKINEQTKLGAVPALRRMQAEAAAELDALPPGILQPLRSFDPTGDRASKGGS